MSAEVPIEAASPGAPLLEVSGLVTSFRTDEGLLRAVDDVSFTVPRGRTVGLVGESGCGKSVTALSVLRLLPEPAGRIERGTISLGGKDLVSLSEPEVRAIRGRRIAMIFQEPMTSLNPVYTVGSQIVEALRLHRRGSRKEAWDRTEKLLGLVGIADPPSFARRYPHELSGGMRQRVMIAMALSCEPELLIADEPTTALDVTIQAQILDLLARLQRELEMSILLITHDLGVVAEYTQHVVVMYAGRVVEKTDTKTLFAKPKHPYTRGLLASLPSRLPRGRARRSRLPMIEGIVPDLRKLPPGCRFQDRCPHVIDACKGDEPPLRALNDDPNHLVRCIRAEELDA